MIHIYWGMGKGKTSTLNGSAIRAIGANKSVLLARFLKGRETSEDEVLQNNNVKLISLHPSVKYVTFMDDNETKNSKLKALETINFIKENAPNFDIIILDEILDLCSKNVGFLSESELLAFIKGISTEKNEIMMSGHEKLSKLFEHADLITYFKPEKHYFTKGIKAREGIEF